MHTSPTEESTGRGKSVRDPEVRAIATVTEALDTLENGGRSRVVAYIRARYAPLFGINGAQTEDAG